MNCENKNPRNIRSVDVLTECAELQVQKGVDYQNPNSSVKQADYYPNGIKTIHDILHAKMLRAKSLIDTFEYNESDAAPNFESLEDTFKDIINYSSFAVAYLEGKIQGQNEFNDMLNKPRSPTQINVGPLKIDDLTPKDH
tara:strand:- start:7902 stop:8321 length:420 start_codon:yes stop_codon:yes gene_type:complete